MQKKQINNLTLTSTTGFFYKANLRGASGLDWGRNINLPMEVRECSNAINLSKDIVERLSDFAVVIMEIYYTSKINGKHSFKGRFRTLAPAIRQWVKINGYYKAKSGEFYLAIPITLWEVAERGESKVNVNQRKLNL